MTEMTCITCPMGCHLQIEKLSDNDISVTGNRCARGENYAREELLSPKRVVTATCRARWQPGSAGAPSAGLASAAALPAGAGRPRRVPLRTSGAFPRERIPELLEAIYRLELELPVKRGQVCIADALGTGVDLIVTRSM